MKTKTHARSTSTTTGDCLNLQLVMHVCGGGAGGHIPGHTPQRRGGFYRRSLQMRVIRGMVSETSAGLRHGSKRGEAVPRRNELDVGDWYFFEKGEKGAIKQVPTVRHLSASARGGLLFWMRSSLDFPATALLTAAAGKDTKTSNNRRSGPRAVVAPSTSRRHEATKRVSLWRQLQRVGGEAKGDGDVWLRLRHWVTLKAARTPLRGRSA